SIGPTCGIGNHTAQGRGLASLDFDNDGDMDVLILTLQEAPRLFRSNLITMGLPLPQDAHWVRVFLDTSHSHGRVAPNGYGARVLASVGSQVQMRYMSPGSTYLCQS